MTAADQPRDLGTLLAGVLGEHVWAHGPVSDARWCRCGWLPTHPAAAAGAFRAHVAAEQAKVVREALAPVYALAEEWANKCYSPGAHTKCKGHRLTAALSALGQDAGALGREPESNDSHAWLGSDR